VREIKLSSGAGFIVAITGHHDNARSSQSSRAEKIDIDETELLQVSFKKLQKLKSLRPKPMGFSSHWALNFLFLPRLNFIFIE